RPPLRYRRQTRLPESDSRIRPEKKRSGRSLPRVPERSETVRGGLLRDRVGILNSWISSWSEKPGPYLSRPIRDVGLLTCDDEPYTPRSFFDFSSTPRANFSLCATNFPATPASDNPIICAAKIP